MKTTQLFFILLILLFPKIGAAQQDSVKMRTRYYTAVGIALGKGSYDGMYLQAHAQVQRYTNYLAVKLSGFEKFELFADEPSPSIGDLSLIFGKSYTLDKQNNLQFGVGLSYVTSVSKGAKLSSSCMFCLSEKYEAITKNTVGLPIELKYNFYINRTGAISFSLNANINSEESYVGAAIGLFAGRLRPKFRN